MIIHHRCMVMSCDTSCTIVDSYKLLQCVLLLFYYTDICIILRVDNYLFSNWCWYYKIRMLCSSKLWQSTRLYEEFLWYKFNRKEMIFKRIRLIQHIPFPSFVWWSTSYCLQYILIPWWTIAFTILRLYFLRWQYLLYRNTVIMKVPLTALCSSYSIESGSFMTAGSLFSPKDDWCWRKLRWKWEYVYCSARFHNYRR